MPTRLTGLCPPGPTAWFAATPACPWCNTCDAFPSLPHLDILDAPVQPVLRVVVAAGAREVDDQPNGRHHAYPLGPPVLIH